MFSLVLRIVASNANERLHSFYVYDSEWSIGTKRESTTRKEYCHASQFGSWSQAAAAHQEGRVAMKPVESLRSLEYVHMEVSVQ